MSWTQEVRKQETNVRNVIYGMMISLDGYVARPDGTLDWVTVDEELHTFINDQHREYGAYLSGRRTHEMMVAAWPAVAEDPEAPGFMLDFADIWKAMPKVVFSRTLEEVGWNARLAQDDITAEVERLKREPGGDMVVGGPTLASTFLELGLIDVVDLFVNPAILGAGIPLFPEFDGSVNMQLEDSKTFDSGVVYLRYRTV